MCGDVNELFKLRARALSFSVCLCTFLYMQRYSMGEKYMVVLHPPYYKALYYNLEFSNYLQFLVIHLFSSVFTCSGLLHLSWKLLTARIKKGSLKYICKHNLYRLLGMVLSNTQQSNLTWFETRQCFAQRITGVCVLLLCLHSIFCFYF